MKFNDINLFIIPQLIDNVHNDNWVLMYTDVSLRIIHVIDSLTYRQCLKKAEKFKLVIM